MSMKYSVKASNIGMTDIMKQYYKVQDWLLKNKDIVVLDIVSCEDGYFITYLKNENETRTP